MGKKTPQEQQQRKNLTGWTGKEIETIKTMQNAKIVFFKMIDDILGMWFQDDK